MHRITLFLFFAFLYSCNITEPVSTADLTGTWTLETVHFVIDGNHYEVEEYKLIQTSEINKSWELRPDQVLIERISKVDKSHNYVFDEHTRTLTLTGQKLYPEVFEVELNSENLIVRSPQLKDASLPYSENTWQKDLILDAAFYLEGQISYEEVVNANKIQRINTFQKKG
ncbi:hypothetical protein [Jiulongibacter sp. NS-SX5]|uniref:hypothetical protein n=1 Tax=Jiulongibacter sp. NS-SX5 TaxID=3463854 RepID=UPI0040592F5C